MSFLSRECNMSALGERTGRIHKVEGYSFRFAIKQKFKAEMLRTSAFLRSLLQDLWSNSAHR